MDHTVRQIRNRNMLTGLTLEAPLRLLDLVDSYYATADALDECGRLLCTNLALLGGLRPVVLGE